MKTFAHNVFVRVRLGVNRGIRNFCRENDERFIHKWLFTFYHQSYSDPPMASISGCDWFEFFASHSYCFDRMLSKVPTNFFTHASGQLLWPGFTKSNGL